MEESETPNTQDCDYGEGKMKVGWCFAPLQNVACPCKADKASCQVEVGQQTRRCSGGGMEGDARGLRKQLLPRVLKILLHPLM